MMRLKYLTKNCFVDVYYSVPFTVICWVKLLIRCKGLSVWRLIKYIIRLSLKSVISESLLLIRSGKPRQGREQVLFLLWMIFIYGDLCQESFTRKKDFVDLENNVMFSKRYSFLLLGQSGWHKN